MKDYKKKLQENGMLLKEIPKKEQNIDMCRIAINQNPKAIRFASQKCIDYEICFNAVKRDVNVFRYVPTKLMTEEMIQISIEADGELINKVPEKYITDELYLKAVKSNIAAFEYIPEEKKQELLDENTPLDLIISWIEKDFTISKFMSQSVKSNIKILKFQKSLDKLTFLNKYYDYEKMVFCIDIEVAYKKAEMDHLSDKTYEVEAKFSTFNEFYNFLDSDISNADLRGYDFKGVNLSQYNIKGAVIDSYVLINQGLYDGEYYSNLKKQIEIVEDSEDITDEISIKSDYCYLRPVEDEGHEVFDDTQVPFFYISDIHLLHRVINKFKYSATKEEVELYIKELVQEMVDSIGSKPWGSYLLIAGDTSSVFELSKVFYSELVNWWNPRRIVVILGNHELWDPYVELKENISAYRLYFKSMNINYLQNDLLYVDSNEEIKIVKEKHLVRKSTEDIRKLVEKSSIIILGGIGFSGLNEKYNATNMRYGKSFEESSDNESRIKDIKESNKFNFIYEKLLKAIPRNKVIILTHMKKSDWNLDDYNPNWIYLNGHTHYEYTNNKNIYADNQIGYKRQTLGLKYFYIDNEYDIFAYTEDGIHEITKEQYIDFNRGKKVTMTFNKREGTIYMIKKNNYYMFLIYCYYSKSSSKEKLYLLNGGRLHKLEDDWLEDLDYYFHYLDQYTESIHKLLDKYTGKQKIVSDFVKSLGGSGKIHGCIVDVEKPGGLFGYSYCHLFVNPVDGQVTPYFALDVTSRIFYKDFKSMLEEQPVCRLLKDKYLKLEKESATNSPKFDYSKDMEKWINNKSLYDEGSWMYKISRIIKSLQYCTEKNIVRIWNDKVIELDYVKGITEAENVEGMIDEGLIVEVE